MSLREGAETIVDQCLKIQDDESVVVVNDSNNQELIDAILDRLDEKGIKYEYMQYEEPETAGTEPPEEVATRMKESDVFIAPTVKSISHTKARFEALESGSRGVTLPGINREVWNAALQADFERVKEITEKAMEKTREISKVRIETPKGTDLQLKVDAKNFDPDTGMVLEEGGFSNLPAGEIFTGPLNAEGKIVIEENVFGVKEDKGDIFKVENGELKEIEEAPENSRIKEKVEKVENARNIAEFGLGTNPEAYFSRNLIQDEKILGTVHIALGDNSFCFPDGHEKEVESEIHWDFVLKNPTVWFDDERVLDEGEPVFLD